MGVRQATSQQHRLFQILRERSLGLDLATFSYGPDKVVELWLTISSIVLRTRWRLVPNLSDIVWLWN